MSMTDEERSTLVRLELEKAHDTFEEIEIQSDKGQVPVRTASIK